MITVNFALEQGKEVFAVPGSVESGLNAGCHRMLREGACLVERAQDVLEAFGMAEVKPKTPEAVPVELTPDQERLLDLIGFNQRLTDELIEESGLPAAQVSSDLMMLEIHGKVKKLPGGLYVRVALFESRVSYVTGR